MFVVTAANDKFQDIIGFWEERVIACGQTPIIYDLGGLGIGEKFVTDHIPGFDNFMDEGYYHLLANGQWKSRAVHKPFVVEKAMADLHAPFLYLDADAIIRGNPSKMYGDNHNSEGWRYGNGIWDISLTIRPEREWDKTTEAKREFIGRINAGVMWFNNTASAHTFVSIWKQKTLEELNDQRALNLMLPKIGRKYGHSMPPNIFVKPFPTEAYNHYYKTGIENALIVHLKNNEWVGMNRQQLLERCRLREMDRWQDDEEVYDYFVDDEEFDLFVMVMDWDTSDLIMDIAQLPSAMFENWGIPEVPLDDGPGLDEQPLGMVENPTLVDQQGS